MGQRGLLSKSASSMDEVRKQIEHWRKTRPHRMQDARAIVAVGDRVGPGAGDLCGVARFAYQCVLSAAVRDGSGIVALGSGPSTAIQWRKPVHGTTRAIVEVCFEYG